MNFALALSFAVAALVTTLATAPPLAAQDWPARPLRLVVPLAPGGQPDIVARLLAQGLSDRLRQPVLVENRPGAQTNLAMEAVARAAPDGYSFLFALTSLAINPHLQALAFDPMKDFEPVAPVAHTRFVLLSSPELPARTLKELLDWARARPDRLSCAHAGGITQIACARFAFHNRVAVLLVPYRSNTLSYNDLARGEVHILFDGLANAMPNVRAGRFTLLNETEALGGFELTGWLGVVAPAGTPAPVVNRMNEEIGAVLAAPEVRGRLVELGVQPAHESPRAFAAFLQREHARYGRVIRETGLKAD